MLTMLTAALFATAVAVPEQIDVAQANWSAFPRLETEHIAVPNGEMVRRVQLMLQQDVCEFQGQSARRFDIDVNYAVMLDAQGNATRIIVQDVGCRSLETYVGQIAANIVRSGYVRVTPPAEPRWFGNRINFNLE